MPRKLKVFRTAAGFHDAYVAAPSRKAALAAWGADVDLFARGVAEEVSDPALMEAPLAAPGTVVKRSRGTAAEQLAAAPRPTPRGKTKAAKRAPPAPRPDRGELDAAEAALDAGQKAVEAERRDLAKRLAGLEREQRAVERRWRTERTALEEERDAARSAYDAAMARWRAG